MEEKLAFDYMGLGTTALGWLRSFVFWGILAGIVIIFGIGSLIIRKRRKLQYPCIELTNLGAGKMGLKNTQAGWFKSKSMFFGLIDYGDEEVLKTKDTRIIQKASSKHFQDINGKRGIVCQRKSDDPAILVPIRRMVTDNERLMLEIAPADYRDASVRIINASDAETRGKLEKYLPYIMLGSLALILFICIILIVQMVKSSQAEASRLILEAGRVVQSGVATASEVAP